MACQQASSEPVQCLYERQLLYYRKYQPSARRSLAKTSIDQFDRIASQNKSKGQNTSIDDSQFLTKESPYHLFYLPYLYHRIFRCVGRICHCQLLIGRESRWARSFSRLSFKQLASVKLDDPRLHPGTTSWSMTLLSTSYIKETKVKEPTV